jgi:hypothetical protein
MPVNGSEENYCLMEESGIEAYVKYNFSITNRNVVLRTTLFTGKTFILIPRQIT